MSQDCFNLLVRLLKKEPIERITIKGALATPWFNDIREALNISLNLNEANLKPETEYPQHLVKKEDDPESFIAPKVYKKNFKQEEAMKIKKAANYLDIIKETHKNRIKPSKSTKPTDQKQPNIDLIGAQVDVYPPQELSN